VSDGDSWSQFLYQGLMWPTIPASRTPEWTASIWVASEFGADYPEMGWGGALFSSFAAYRMAGTTGVSNRNVFMIQAVTAVLLPLVSIIATIWMISTLGLGRTSEQNWSGAINGLLSRVETGSRPTTPPWIPYTLLGIVIVGLLSFMHARFLWWPVDPAGYILATSVHPLLEGIWLPFLVAWIAKTATLRVGGSKAYENYGVPMATGFLTGTTLSILIGGGIGVLQFFHPF